VVTIVLNNKAWGMCVHGQRAMFGSNRLVVTTLGDSRYDEVAQGFGCHGTFVDRLEDIGPAVTEALASGLPACLNLITDLEAVYGETESRQASEATPSERSDTKIEMPYYDNLEQD
jgi:acetolactate synthase-1/2/3 large subunit